MSDDEVKKGGFNEFIQKPISKTKFDDLIKKYR
jgi:FixJ family two-component response regulator